MTNPRELAVEDLNRQAIAEAGNPLPWKDLLKDKAVTTVDVTGKTDETIARLPNKV